ncbi:MULTISPECIES: ribonuclease J1 [Bacillota]|uniref:Ribonuclease J n=2 Tax=Amedibacillus TaxID=2749846 RepID=A0A7G9GMX5_9FIRM|nr:MULTISPECIES: ribonuclease J [Bacillota]QNM12157.1 ribonuclease J [[Eubacterium] hominis]RGB49492.1 ribonuclease J [Absiella sp. AM22-9]RGB63744.1 ribonuclease J [Absiella sp. AM09-45]RGB72904.1 ribonuclease J [Absiella sp. AM09-50]RGC21794.1 ribonuclease J [Absiella sp. AM54-8XD]
MNNYHNNKQGAPRTHQDPTRNSYNKMNTERNDTLIYALGGLGEVGKNMYCFEHENEILIVDAGVRFPEDNLLGVDYVIPDYGYLVKNNRKRKVLVITHGHEDHIGGIPFLLKSVDIEAIYAPAFAVALINKKLEERKMLRSVKLIEINDRSSLKMNYFTCGFFNTTHSIPDSLGILINTPNGRIVTTGDFKFDLTPVGNNADYQVMAYMGQIGVDLLLSDSTNSGVEDFSISEKKVAQEILDIMKKTSGRLIVATFASNIYRVSQILEAAVACGRKVIIFGRSMENVVTIGRKMGKIKVGEQHFLSIDQLSTTPANKTCIVCTGSQGEPLAALSRIANGTHRYIKLIPGDTVIFSSSPIPGNGASVNQVVNKLFRAGANVLTKSVLTNLHTTGHASQEEQKLMLQLIKPKYFMPVHGEYKMLKQHKDTAIETGIPRENIFTCANGDVLILRDHKVYESSFRIPADDIYVDGNDISGVSTAVLKDRKILADNGLVAVIIAIDSKDNKVLCKPVIVSRGFVFIKDSQGLLKEAEMIVYDALNEKMKQRTTFSDLKNTVRGSLEPFLYNKTHRNPIVIPVIINSKSAMQAMAQARAARMAGKRIPRNNVAPATEKQEKAE